MTFYLSFIAFIISIIGGLILMLIGKNMGRDKFKLMASIHFILLLAFIASLILKKDNSIVVNNYFFTVFICSGLVLSGLAWRVENHKIVRYYFSLFLLTIPMFMFSPSMLMNFLFTTHYNSTTGQTFHLTGRYYLEQQNTVTETDDILHYKVITKNGIFHKTIQRDVVFHGTLDSAKVLKMDSRIIVIRGYSSNKTYVSEEIDSSDVEITIRKIKPGVIEYRL